MTNTVDWMRLCDDLEKRFGRPAKALIGTDDLRHLVEDLSSLANAYANDNHVEDCTHWTTHGQTPCDCGLPERFAKAREVLSRRPEIWEQL